MGGTDRSAIGVAQRPQTPLHIYTQEASTASPSTSLKHAPRVLHPPLLSDTERREAAITVAHAPQCTRLKKPTGRSQVPHRSKTAQPAPSLLPTLPFALGSVTFSRQHATPAYPYLPGHTFHSTAPLCIFETPNASHSHQSSILLASSSFSAHPHASRSGASRSPSLRIAEPRTTPLHPHHTGESPQAPAHPIPS